MKAILLSVLFIVTYAGTCKKHSATDNCMECINDEGITCSKCNYGFKLIRNDKSTDTLCLPCEYTSCQTCDGSDKCESCSEGISIDENKDCKVCTDKTYLAVNRECILKTELGCSDNTNPNADDANSCRCKKINGT